jgi:hypothetical protein
MPDTTEFPEQESEQQPAPPELVQIHQLLSTLPAMFRDRLALDEISEADILMHDFYTSIRTARYIVENAYNRKVDADPESSTDGGDGHDCEEGCGCESGN